MTKEKYSSKIELYLLVNTLRKFITNFLMHKLSESNIFNKFSTKKFDEYKKYFIELILISIFFSSYSLLLFFIFFVVNNLLINLIFVFISKYIINISNILINILSFIK